MIKLLTNLTSHSLGGGALTTYPSKLSPKIFQLPPSGVYLHPLHPPYASTTVRTETVSAYYLT